MIGADADRDLPQREPTLRPFNVRRDLDQVLEFQNEVYEGNFPGFAVDAYFREDFSRDLRRAARDPNETLLVMEQGGALCGFIWVAVISTIVDPRVGYIKNVYVTPHLRGRGQAERLMRAAEEWFGDQGIEKMMLDVSVMNPRAVAFYEKLDYVTERVRMVKRLGSAQMTGGLPGGVTDE